MEKAYYTEKPNKITYMPLPNGFADVWLRENIRTASDSEGNDGWECDEVYLRTVLSEKEVAQKFDELFEKGSHVPVAVGLEERVDALESAVTELVEVLING